MAWMRCGLYLRFEVANDCVVRESGSTRRLAGMPLLFGEQSLMIAEADGSKLPDRLQKD
ncbi:hypothetical protein J27TS7_19640 [Paenibacillus dendritiformis]|nr:hypothetical protein J27TS7_19640 [Paenibacillus dendritiformis]